MLLKNIHFVLIRPQLGENIGASARVLKNFNCENLRLINPRDSWPNKKARATAVEAKDVIDNAKIFTQNDQAVEDLHYVFATTSRSRSVNKKILNLDEALKLINTFSNKKNIGILFGPESSGLSNQDLENANYLVNIPTNIKFKSLNLSHAISVFAYNLFVYANKPSYSFKNLYRSDDASKKEVQIFLKFLIDNLDKVGFLKPEENRKLMIMNIKNIFHRSLLSTQEIRTLSGIISSFIKYKSAKRID